MLGFWDRLWAVSVMEIRDYFWEVEQQKKKWEEYCIKCKLEIIDESIRIADIIMEAAEKQSSSRIHNAVVDGIKQLPLYGFYLVLQDQKEISKEQLQLINSYLVHMNIPYSYDAYMQTIREKSNSRQELLKLVEVSDTYAGDFWVQFFKILYRTESDTTYINKLIQAFANITMRFAALNANTEDRLLVVLEKFVHAVHQQAILCRSIPNDSIDVYGDAPFIEHFDKYKEQLFLVCNYCMDEDDEDFNPTGMFHSFTIGIIYQIIHSCRRGRADKETMMDDIFSKVDIGINSSAKDIFHYMEDIKAGENTTMLAYYAHMLTDIKGEGPLGWILLNRFGGTYNIQTGREVSVIKDAINFLMGMENYLEKKYPMSGFGSIASDYARTVLEIINKDIDENMTII